MEVLLLILIAAVVVAAYYVVLQLRGIKERTGIAATALMFFAGLRPGEARGICWEHYDGKRLFVTQSVWRKLQPIQRLSTPQVLSR
jgi:integrase